MCVWVQGLCERRKSMERCVQAGEKVAGYVYACGNQGRPGKGMRCGSTGKLRERACWVVC